MSTIVINDNLVKLRKISNDICFTEEETNKTLSKKLKKVIYDSKIEIDKLITTKTKLNYYEKLFSNITNILNNK